MITLLSVRPAEKGTAVITIIPKDEAGNVLTLDDLIDPQWQLMRMDGSVVNGRTFANSNGVASLEVVLTGEDLALVAVKESGKRHFSFQARYNSSLGSGLHLTAEVAFVIQDILGQVNI